MKKSELTQLIREEISKIIKESIELTKFKTLLNRYSNNDRLVNMEDLGKSFRKLNSNEHELAFKAIENSKSDWILDDEEFYIAAGNPIRVN